MSTMVRTVDKIKERETWSERRRRVDRLRKVAKRGGVYVILSVIGLTTLIPFIAMVLLAITPPGALHLPSLIPTALTISNFDVALASDSILRWTVNSIIYAVVSIVLSLFLASLAGYAFAKKRFVGRDLMFWSFVAMLMVPGQLTIVPLFILIAEVASLPRWVASTPTGG
jgi:multiple sugar transport system permease protein